MPSADPGAPARAPGRRRALARRAGPRARSSGPIATGSPAGISSSTAAAASTSASPSSSIRPSALICWAHYAPPISDMFRKSYRRLLRWNDEFPFAKFSVGEDERPLLAVELPIADWPTADALGLALARIVGDRRPAARRVGGLAVDRRPDARPVDRTLEQRRAPRPVRGRARPSCSTAAEAARDGRRRARRSRRMTGGRTPASRVARPRARRRDRACWRRPAPRPPRSGPPRPT